MGNRIWALGVLTFTACSATLDHDAYTDAMSEAVCARVAECCAADEVGWTSSPRDEGTCRSDYASVFSTGIMNAGRLVAGGESRYAPDRFEACLAHLRAASCAELAEHGAFSTPIDPCGDIVTPALELGQPCSAPSACRSGFCPSTTRVCTAVAGAGEPCTEAMLCAGTSCSTIGVCRDAFCDQDGVCRTRRALGEACASDVACESGRCDPAAGCVEPAGLACDGL